MTNEPMRRFGWLLLGALSACGNEADAPVAEPLPVLDLDPASGGATVVVESITADAQGKLYIGDRVTGNLLRIDPSTNSAARVARIAARNVGGMDGTKADPAGMLFDAQGNLLIASAPFSEVLRVNAAELDPQNPGSAETFASGVAGANSLALDSAGRLYVSGGASGNIYRVGAEGGAAEVFAHIEAFSRAVPPDGFMMNVVANGLAFDANGALLVADTARGAVWKIVIGSDGAAAAPTEWAKSPLLEGIDGLGFDAVGLLWGAVNEQNQLVTISTAGNAQRMFKNDSDGPFEYPTAIVFVGTSGYVVNLDRARRDNFAADGMTSLDGVGASIVVVPSTKPAPPPRPPTVTNGGGY